MLDAALDLAARRLPVFQLHAALETSTGRRCTCGSRDCRDAAKHPWARFAPRGLQNATTAEHVVRNWWTAEPRANIGLATGRVAVLDIDPRHGGDESLLKIEDCHGPLPHTWRALTGGGGEHIYFLARGTVRNSAGRIGPGLDMRGVGGYVVAPPSIHISGRRYAWSVDHHPDEVPLAPMPEWLTEATGEPGAAAAAPAENWRRLAAEGVQDGGRNNAVARLTGHLLRRYVDPVVALELVQAWNATRCQPPLKPEEVTKAVASIARKEQQRREVRHGRL